MTERLINRGTLEGHSGWVTSLATSLEKSVKLRQRPAGSLTDMILQPKHATLSLTRQDLDYLELDTR